MEVRSDCSGKVQIAHQLRAEQSSFGIYRGECARKRGRSMKVALTDSLAVCLTLLLVFCDKLSQNTPLAPSFRLVGLPEQRAHPLPQFRRTATTCALVCLLFSCCRPSGTTSPCPSICLSQHRLWRSFCTCCETFEHTTTSLSP